MRKTFTVTMESPDGLLPNLFHAWLVGIAIRAAVRCEPGKDRETRDYWRTLYQ